MDVKICFYNDPETDLPHIFKHGVTEDEAEEVLEHPLEERRGAGKSTVIIGRTASGRMLKIIYSDRGGEILVITGYDLRGKALRSFWRRMKK